MKNLKQKFSKALVTGGAGFVGSHICEELIKQDIDTICVDNFVAGKMENISHLINNKKFSWVDADISHFSMIIDLFQGVDVVFHQAASKCTVCMVDPHLDLNVNALGTYNVLECSRRHGVSKIVHASTGSVYGEGVTFPQSEDHPLNPVSFYGVSKLAGEKYCSAFLNYYDMDITVLRYFHVYGTRQEYSDLGGVIPIFARRILSDESPIIFGDGEQLRSFTYVKDDVAANFHVALDKRSRGQVYNCASGIKVSISELAKILLKILKREDLEIIYKDVRPGDIKYFDIDNSKLRNLGFDFKTSFEDGLIETINWVKTKI